MSKRLPIVNKLGNEKVKLASDLANGYWNDKSLDVIDDCLTPQTIV